MKKLGTAILFFFALSATAAASTKDIANCIRSSTCRRTFVVAHRAKGLGSPENSREAVKRAIEAKVPIIEIDIRYSKDQYLYVLHDSTLDRTTSQSGKLSEKISIELEGALLENDETLPMLQDIYDISQGKAVLDLDFKNNAVEEVAEWIARAGSFDDVIFFVNTLEEMKSAAKMKAKYPDMIVMARQKNLISIEQIEEVFGKDSLPEIIHTDFPDEGYVEFIQSKGKKIFVNSLRPERFPQPFKYLALLRIEGLGLDFIQTDLPTEWLNKKQSKKFMGLQ